MKLRKIPILTQGIRHSPASNLVRIEQVLNQLPDWTPVQQQPTLCCRRHAKRQFLPRLRL
ncbi:hypothetical protein [Allofranklinella schreckenbergeri]|uniref:hypothetical protein n=1 Tax=Allofranklinella schreckenbergeri TaxID=1076744 RepID=UPI0011C44A52|nr:hypothetical protein [Allofranklinella schreckenbergeri]